MVSESVFVGENCCFASNFDFVYQNIFKYKTTIYLKMGNITQNWVDLLFPFTKNYFGKYSGTQLAKKTGIPQQTASRYLKELEKSNLIEFEKVGRNKLYYFNFNKLTSKSIIRLLEESKTIDFLKKQKDISPVIKELKDYTETIIVFGSYSSYKQTKHSDLDVVLIKTDKDLLRQTKDRSVVEINEHVVSYKEFEEEIKSENPLALEILSNHTIIGNMTKMADMIIASGKWKR